VDRPKKARRPWTPRRRSASERNEAFREAAGEEPSDPTKRFERWILGEAKWSLIAGALGGAVALGCWIAGVDPKDLLRPADPSARNPARPPTWRAFDPPSTEAPTPRLPLPGTGPGGG
jgi:hypothetical protein